MRELPATTCPTNYVFFRGKPSQVINLPYLLGGVLALTASEIAYFFASQHWHLTPAIAALPFVLIGLRVTIPYLRTAFTEVIIDAERVTRRRGILTRTVSSLELFRIQDVTSLHPWWQRPFGIGTVVLMTSDSNNPVWFLPGIANAEEMRNDLNHAAIALRDQKGIREVNMGRV